MASSAPAPCCGSRSGRCCRRPAKRFGPGLSSGVAALVADLTSANAGRRAAIVSAEAGAVLDWLLEAVPTARDGTQAEAARALANLVADPAICGAVLGRPHAVPNLLRFISSFQPHNGKKKQVKSSSFGGADAYKGRSMLVAAIMDIVTSSINNAVRASFQPILPGHASMEDILAALQVIEAGSMHFEDSGEHDEGEDGSGGLRGIGIKVLRGTTVLGFAGMNDFQNVGNIRASVPGDLLLERSHPSFPMIESLAPTVTPELGSGMIYRGNMFLYHLLHGPLQTGPWPLSLTNVIYKSSTEMDKLS